MQEVPELDQVGRSTAARARALLDQFELAWREGEADGYYRATGDAARALMYVVHDNGDVWPNDWRYAVAVDCLEALAHGETPEVELSIDFEVWRLLQWLNGPIARSAVVDQLMESTHFTSLSDAIQAGQREFIESIFGVILGLLEDDSGE